MLRRFSWLILSSILLVTGCNTSSETIAEITTDYGVMKVRLFDSTPNHRDNFIKLANEGYFDGSLFHRVIPNFMIQGGDPESKTATPDQMLGNGGPGYTLAAEFGEYHFRGALAAARLGDQVNPQKESSGSQFYIVQGQPVNEQMLTQIEQRNGIQYTPEQRQKYAAVGGTPFLDNNYTVFGEVIEGMEVIDKISAVATGQAARPKQDVKMTIRIL